MITKRLLGVQIALLLGFNAVFLLPHSNKSTPAGIAMALPEEVGDWTGEDEAITQREIDVLAKDTKFVRKTYTARAGDKIFVTIILSGDDMTSSIHRPERCLAAQAWGLQDSEKRVLPLDGGKSLETTKLHSVRLINLPDDSHFLLHALNYYWFIGSEEMTASHLVRTGIDLRDRILRGQAQRWAYVTVAGFVPRRGRTQEETRQIIEQFIRELAPKLTRPDGSPLL
jgi:EpsI family protein